LGDPVPHPRSRGGDARQTSDMAALALPSPLNLATPGLVPAPDSDEAPDLIPAPVCVNSFYQMIAGRII